MKQTLDLQKSTLANRPSLKGRISFFLIHIYFLSFIFKKKKYLKKEILQLPMAQLIMDKAHTRVMDGLMSH